MFQFSRIVTFELFTRISRYTVSVAKDSDVEGKFTGCNIGRGFARLKSLFSTMSFVHHDSANRSAHRNTADVCSPRLRSLSSKHRAGTEHKSELGYKGLLAGLGHGRSIFCVRLEAARIRSR